MKNLRHSRKALSPVVASIILIAVTVAVSIAVAAWMGALTTGFMATEELKITSVEFGESGTGFYIYLRNTGSTAVTISDVYIQNSLKTTASNITSAGMTLQPNEPGLITLAQEAYTAGQSYQIKITTTKGNPFVYTATAPT